MKKYDEGISSVSQVSVPRMTSGWVLSTSTSIFLLFFLTLWKLISIILKNFFVLLLGLGTVGLGNEAAPGDPTDCRLVSLKLAELYEVCERVPGDGEQLSSFELEKVKLPWQ